MKFFRKVASRTSLGVVFLIVPSKKPASQYQVGDRVTVSLSSGRVVEATVRAVVSARGGVRLQVDYGHDETALVEMWQVRAGEP